MRPKFDPPGQGQTGRVGLDFGPFAEAEISVDMIVQNVSADGETANITFTVARKDLRNALEVLQGVKDKVGYHELSHSLDVSKVSVIGIGMRSHAGVATKMFKSWPKRASISRPSPPPRSRSVCSSTKRIPSSQCARCIRPMDLKGPAEE